MKILITNDDGVFSDGLRVLVRHLRRKYDLSVVVPDGERSGYGHALTLLNPLRVYPINDGAFDGVDAWMTNGTPMDCVILGVEALVKDNISLVVSGINNGFNLGDDIFHSGTVAAAMEGALLGIPSIAISSAPGWGDDFWMAAKVVDIVAEKILESGLPDMVFLNINVPKSVQGVEVTVQGRRRYIGKVNKYVDPRGLDCFWIGGKIEDEGDRGTDVFAVKNDMVSITPVNLDVTDRTMLSKMRELGYDIEKRCGFEK